MAGYLVVGALLGAMATLRHPRAGPAERAAMSSTRTAALALSGRAPHSTDDRILPEALQLGKAEQWPKLLRQFQSSEAGRNITRHVVACVLSAALAVTPSTAAWADEKRLVGEIPTSGLVFKDTLRVESYTDPKVAGVQLFLGDFSIPATEKFAKGDVFSDPSNASLSCSRKGRVVVSAGASEKLEGEEVIADSKNLFFKSVKVRRLVDKKSGNVVYAAFSQRVDTGGDSNKSRFSNSICAVPVDEFESAQ
jgi:catabolite regulation protein CreA